jgi:signal transduction histidine kinase
VLVTTRAGADGSARIEVKDDGPGIEPEHRVRVFERFYRVDKARSREVGGSGLGLAIAKTVFVAHGGDITCTSEAGVGSAFVISLPIVEQPDSHLTVTN